MIYKGIFLDTECTYMPEIKQLKSIQYITKKQPCVAHLPDIETGFKSVEDAKKYIDDHEDEIQRELNKPWPD